MGNFLMGMPDVHFVFEVDNETVKLPAHKAILAASSPVFDAMFNGELKDQGDVNIIDVSLAAFKEFLQLFYGHPKEFTMNNIAEVLMLIDKYDVAGGFSVCVRFLKLKLTIDDILWGLHSAIKYRLNELMVFCSTDIRKHTHKVWNMLEAKGDQITIKASSNPNNWSMSKEDEENVFHYVLVLLEDIVSSQTAEIERLSEESSNSIGGVNTEEGAFITDVEIVELSLKSGKMRETRETQRSDQD